MIPRARYVQLVAFAVLVLTCESAFAARFALLLGNNRGASDDVALQHAESDAQRMARTLQEVGHVPAENLVMLQGRGLTDVRRAFELIAARSRNTIEGSLVFFYYSGHADSAGLHLGAETLSFRELRQLLAALNASARVAVVDACQAGTLTRTKGGRPGPSFGVSAAAETATGLAILTSASDREFAQESDQLQGSFFTHHLESGLRGLADRNRNGEVTLSEAFDYASAQTLTSTSKTNTGPQHPSFRYDMAGERELVLTFPGTARAGYGTLTFDLPGWYLVYTRTGELVSEFQSPGGDELMIAAGELEVIRRHLTRVQAGALNLSAGTKVRIGSLYMADLNFGREVRKGVTHADTSYAVSVTGIGRTSLMGLGPAFGAGAQVRIETSIGSLEVGLGAARSKSETQIPSETLEVGGTVSALRTWDWPGFTTSVGIELGWSAYRQQVRSVPARLASVPAAGPVLEFEIPLSRLFLRADSAVPVSGLSVARAGNQRRVVWSPALRLRLGLGLYF